MRSVDDHRLELREIYELHESRTDARFQAIDSRFAKVDARFDSIDARFDRLETRLDARFAAMDSRFAQFDAQLEARLARTSADLIKWTFLFWCGSVGLWYLAR